MNSTREAIATAHRRSSERWPTLDVPLEFFDAYVTKRSAPPENLDELYLACACASVRPGAIEALETWCAGELDAVFRRASASTRDEVLQVVRSLLFVPGTKGALIEDYRGQGSLKGWVRVVAVRELLRVEKQAARAAPGSISGPALVAPALELDYLEARHRADFRLALASAARALTARERNLLRHHFLDGLGVDQIGAIYQVHRATAARWVAAARKKLMEKTRASVAQRLQLNREELNSLIRAVRSRLSLSVGSLLASVGGEAVDGAD